MNAQTSRFVDIGSADEFPLRGARVVRSPGGDIAVFRSADNEVFAVRDSCPHKRGPLSQGIMHGKSVTCPLHNWVIDLETGQALGADEGCTNVLRVKIHDGRVLLDATALASVE